MDRSSPYYGVGIIIVSMITFLFLFFVLPYFNPLIRILVLTGMLFFVGISFMIRTRRMQAQSRDIETRGQGTNIEQYIKQIDEIMQKK